VRTRGTGGAKKTQPSSSTEVSVESLDHQGERGAAGHPVSTGGATESLTQKKGTTRPQAAVGKKQHQPPKMTKGSQQKPVTNLAPSVETNATEEDLLLHTPELSQSPVMREDEERSVASSGVNESVRASLQLLKKKPRARGGILGRGSSTAESVDTTHQHSPEEHTALSSPNQPPPSVPQNQRDAAPIPPLPPPPLAQKKTSLPAAGARRPQPTPGNCTRTSDCTCSLCVIPVEELPIVMTTTTSQRHLPEREEGGEVMIGSSKLTTLMKTRQEMNKQKTGKKKEVKSAMYVLPSLLLLLLIELSGAVDGEDNPINFVKLSPVPEVWQRMDPRHLLPLPVTCLPLQSQWMMVWCSVLTVREDSMTSVPSDTFPSARILEPSPQP
jgi:hypothetical protein